MKLECKKDVLRDALTLAERLTGRNLSLPVLSGVLLEVMGEILVIRATNLDVGVEIKIPVKVEKEGQVVIKGGTLISLLNNLKEDKIKLELVNENILVSSVYHTILVKALPVGDFPSLPIQPESEDVEISAETLVGGLKSVFFSSATSSIKPEINSVYLYSEENQLFFVATDSFRLSERKIIMPSLKSDLEMIIPAKNVAEIIRLFENVGDKVVLNYNKNQLAITSSNFYFISRLIDGVYPDYRQIVPKEAKTEVILTRDDLLANLKLVNVFANKLNQIDCKVQPNNKNVEIVSQNSEVGESAARLGAEITGEPIEMSFNVRYLLEMFQSLSDQEVIIKFNGKTKPVLFRGVADPSFSYLVMPMNR